MLSAEFVPGEAQENGDLGFTSAWELSLVRRYYSLV